MFTRPAGHYTFDRFQDAMEVLVMSIWSELLFLHGHLTQVPGSGGAAERPASSGQAEEADRLREALGCRSASIPRPEPRGPLLGVRGLA